MCLTLKKFPLMIQDYKISELGHTKKIGMCLTLKKFPLTVHKQLEIFIKLIPAINQLKMIFCLVSEISFRSWNTINGSTDKCFTNRQVGLLYSS